MLKNIFEKKNVSECKMLQYLIQNVGNRNKTYIYYKEHDNVGIENEDIVKGYIIRKDNDTIFNVVWNVYAKNEAPNPVEKNGERKTKRVLSDDNIYIYIYISRKAARK